jgi:hypothetical protein
MIWRRVFLAVDMFIDVPAENREAAIKMVEDLAAEAMDECRRKLADLGFMEGGVDSAFISDTWSDGELKN